MRKPLLFVLAFAFLAGCQSEPVVQQDPLFQLLDPSETGVTFVNEVRNTEAHNIIQYLYYYNGGGVAVGDVNGDNLPDIFFSANRLQNKLYINKGNLQFEDQTGTAGVEGRGLWKTGASMVDINADGWLDIYVCQVGDYKRYEGINQLFVNKGDGTFEEKAAEYGLDFVGFSQQAAWLDYDGDGDLDCFLLNHSVHSPQNYQDVRVRKTRDEKSGDRLYRNDNGYFTDVSKEAQIYGARVGFGLGVVVEDFDRNGWPDIYVTNDFHENDYLYLNQGNGKFEEQLTNAIGLTSQFSMGVDAADLNNDQWPDLLSLDMKPEDERIKKESVGPDPFNIYEHKLNFGYHYQYARNSLQSNMGTLPGEGLQFAEIGQFAGLPATDWSWSCLMADYDNDGWKDIFISNGIWTRPNDLDYLKYISDEEIQESASDVQLISEMPEGLVANYAFQNHGNWNFTNQSKAWGLDLVGCSNGAAYADLDADGDLDLVLNNLNLTASVYQNTSTENGASYLQVALEGAEVNPFAYGAKAQLFLSQSVQTGTLSPVRGWQSSVEPLLHFGIPEGQRMDSLVITWPDGKQLVRTGLSPNERLTLKYDPEGRIALLPEPPKRTFQPTEMEGLEYTHRENSFTDFNMEKLLPYELSEEGPCMALGDVNGDGLEDVFIGASKGKIPQFFLQEAGGRFAKQEDKTFEADLLWEDVDALLFDADSDQDLDLYIVSGGGEYPEGYEQLQDRLYLNDGTGKFTRTMEYLPGLSQNGSCVVPLDFDKDGDTDLFVGSRSVPRSYGQIPISSLLRNNGKGRFEEVTKDILPALAELGMITDAAWEEQSQKLYLVGHWMPVVVADFSQPIPSIEKREEHGWWNTIELADLDGNGQKEAILGNLGWNTDLGKGNPEEPIGLYTQDFDQNYSLDPVMSYYRDGKEVPFNWKDDLVGQILPLKRRFIDYERYAYSSLEEVFEASLETAEYKKADAFGSAIWWDLDPDQEFTYLPDEIQWAPVEAVLAKGNQLILAGNKDGFTPALGRQTASFGWLIEVNPDRSMKVVDPYDSGLAIKGFCRQLETMSLGETQVLLALRNGAALGAWNWKH